MEVMHITSRPGRNMPHTLPAVSIPMLKLWKERVQNGKPQDGKSWAPQVTGYIRTTQGAVMEKWSNVLLC